MPDDHPFVIRARREQAITDMATILLAGVALAFLRIFGVL